MSINLKDPETEQLVRSTAKLTGEGITETIRLAVVHLAKIWPKKEDEVDKRKERLKAIRLRADKRETLDCRTADQILGYDDSGSPT